MAAAGIHPLPGCILAVALFVLLSEWLFLRAAYPEYVYGLLSLGLIAGLGERDRNDFLLFSFNAVQYYRIRMLENVLAIVPFMAFLAFKGKIAVATILFLSSVLLALVRIKRTAGFTIPTPFYRYPFEFIAGFRVSWPFLLPACFLAYKAVEAGNFNLGLFSLVLVFLIAATYYVKPEPVYFVWIYALDVRAFVLRKLLTALICATILTAPVFLTLLIFFPAEWGIIAGVQLSGYLLLFAIILAKYSAFPAEMGLPHAILFGLSLWFPPALLVVIPVFYHQARKRLNDILL